MKKIFPLLFALGCILVTGCSKDDKPNCDLNSNNKKAPESEVSALSDSLEKYGIHSAALREHPDGFFYQVEENGVGEQIPNLCTPVTFGYTARFFDGRQFDAGTIVLGLLQTIAGFQKGLPLVKVGGRIILYLPPSMGYGSRATLGPNGEVIVPPNSYTVFDVTVQKIQ